MSILKVCLICKKEFKLRPSRSHRLYCSRECMGKSQIGKIPWNKGKKVPQISGKNNPMFGKIPTPEVLQKMSKTWFVKGNKGFWLGKKRPNLSGENHPFYGIRRFGKDATNWKGGITSLSELIRRLEENKNWIKNILIRDNYTCKDCGKYGGNLEVHHIKPFQKILNEFLQEYSQFSPMDDKETLVRLAITYKPFWELSNGKTLCKGCHDLVFYVKEIVNEIES